MMNPAEIQIREIEHALITNPNVGNEMLMNLMDKPESVDLVPVIFRVATSGYLIYAAIKILKDHINKNWAALTDEEKSTYRHFIEDSLSNLTNDSDGKYKRELNLIMAQMVIRSYPDDYPDFLEDSVSQGEFEQFTYFLIEMRESPLDVVPQQKRTAIIRELVEKAQFIFQCLIQNYQNTEDALREFIRYINWEMVSQSDFSVIFQQDYSVFGPLCVILQITGLYDPDFINFAFNNLAQLGIPEDQRHVYSKIIPVLKKHINILECEQTIQNLTLVHMRLLDLDFIDHLYYWEPFVIKIYSEYLKSDTRRFNFHYQVLSRIREYVIFHMIQPPDFIIPGVIDTFEHDQKQKENYDDMKSILVCFIGMTPREVCESFMSGIQYLRTNFNQENFLSIIWTLGCISGSTKSQLESTFVVESMKFILDVFQMPGVEKPVIAASFLFLAATYARAQKLTPYFVEVSINLAMQALDSLKTQRIAAKTLLSIAKYSSQFVRKIPQGLLEVVGGAPIHPPTFRNVTEACGRIYQAKEKLETVIKVVFDRFGAVLTEEGVNFNIAMEHLAVMNGFIGLSRVNPSLLEKLVVKNRQMFLKVTAAFGNSIISMIEEDGMNVNGRDDFRLMLEFMKDEATLFEELRFKDCGDILSFYSNLPENYRFPEVLSLVEALYKESDLPPEIVRGLRETVVKPTEKMIVENPRNFPDHEDLLPKVLNAIAQSYFETIDNDDIDLLIGFLLRDSHNTVLATVKALDTIIEKADMKLVEEQRQSFFSAFLPIILYRLMFIITDSSKFFCYSQVLRILYKLFDFVLTGKVRCRIFPDEEDNVKGMSLSLTNMTVQDFPNISFQEMISFFPLLFQEKLPMDKFEELVAQFIARAKQTTQVETLNSLRSQQFKNSVPDFIYF